MRNEDFTPEEAKALLGTEFTYIFPDGDFVPAFIAAIDLKKGLTCKALLRITCRDRYSLWRISKESSTDAEYDNLICVNLRRCGSVDIIQSRLKEIITGSYLSRGKGATLYRCAF